LPPWERFQRFIGIIAKVPKAEADKEGMGLKDRTPKTEKRRRRTAS
jgi:hypothetical protein